MSESDVLTIDEIVEEAVSEMMIMDGVPEVFKTSENKRYALRVFEKELSKY